jgi:hypothetical protein
LSSEVLQQVRVYEKVGAALCDSVEVIAIEQTCLKLVSSEEPQSYIPFLIVDAPSGSGKTQLPFALEARGLTVYHLICNKAVLGSSMQPIYRKFKRTSLALLESLEYDFQVLLKSSALPIEGQLYELDRLGCDQLKSYQRDLRTVQFLFDLFTNGAMTSGSSGVAATAPEPSSFTVSALADWVDALKTQVGAKNVPIVFLDEATGGNDRSKAYIRLMRNILRCIGVVAILMGTNSCAGNLITYSTASRGDKKLWCFLITKLPRLTAETAEVIMLNQAFALMKQNRHDAFVNFVEKYMTTCLPYFLVVMAQVIHDPTFVPHLHSETTLQLMNRLFGKMCLWIRNRKPLLASTNGLRGQLQLQCSAYTPEGVTKEIQDSILAIKETDIFVACHFAQLCHSEICALYALPNMLSLGESEKRWDRQACFPSSLSDPFLYLLFAGPHETEGIKSPFISQDDRRNASVQLRTFAALREVQGDAENKSTATLPTLIVASNPPAFKKEGDALEMPVAIAFGTASRRDGFGGTIFSRFLENLLNELVSRGSIVFCWSPSSILANTPMFVMHFGDKRIPFLSTPNTTWPPLLLLITGTYFANLERPADEEKVDLIAHVAKETNTLEKFVGECKNLSNALTLEKLKEVLKRAPKSSGEDGFCVDVVFASELQQDYFTHCGKSSWDSFVTDNSMTNMNVAKVVIDRENGIFDLKELSRNMKWISWESCRVLVVVIGMEEIEDQSSRRAKRARK